MMNTSMNITWYNLSSNYCKYDEPDSDLEKNAKYIAVVILCVIGICSNIFIIVIAAKYTVRKNLHYLIINMAVSDALFLVCKLWDQVSTKYDTIYPVGVWGAILCKITAFFFIISLNVTLLTLLVISIERFRATRQTLQRSRQYTLRKRVAVISICWLIPTVVYAYPSYRFCGPFPSQPFFFAIMTFSFLTMTIVIITILALSIITVRRLSRPQAILAHLNVDQQRIRKRQSRSTVFMVLASVLLYSCCWCPFSINFLVSKRIFFS